MLEDARLEIWGRLKRSTAGACAVLLSQLSRKNLTGNNVLFQNWYFLGVKNISRHTHKTGSWGGVQRLGQYQMKAYHVLVNGITILASVVHMISTICKMARIIVRNFDNSAFA